MKTLLSTLTILSCIIIASTAQAKSAVQFENPRIFAPLKGSNATAGYVEFKNTTDKEVEIKLVSVENFTAVETHETIEDAGKMAMKKVDSFKVAAKASLELKPGGRHLMLFDATKTITEGSKLKAVFSIDGKNETVQFKVIARQPKTEEHAHH